MLKSTESGNVLSQVFDDESGELHNLRKVDYDSIPDEEVRTITKDYLTQ